MIALFITNGIASKKKKWINKLWYVFTMQFYSAIERNKLLIQAIMDESEKRYVEHKMPTQNNTYFTILLIQSRTTGKTNL